MLAIVRYKERGFTLLEVLVAFIILTLSLVVILAIYSKGTRAVVLGDEYVTAVMIAKSKLASAGIHPDFTARRYSGDVDDKYRWSVELTPFKGEQDIAEPASVYKITRQRVLVKVSWGDSRRPRSIQLDSLKLIPDT